MTTITRKRTLLSLAGTAATVTALLAPAAAQATVPVGATSATWNVRHSWIDYVTNPAWTVGGAFPVGSVTRTANTPAPGDAAPTGDPAGGFSTHDGTTPYGYVFTVKTDAGTPRTLGLRGGLDFRVPGHLIDITLKELRVRVNGSAETLVLDATYKPLTGATQSRGDITFANVSSTGAVTLTAAGAEVFNGGGNGSYAAGNAFGTVAYGS